MRIKNIIVFAGVFLFPWLLYDCNTGSLPDVSEEPTLNASIRIEILTCETDTNPSCQDELLIPTSDIQVSLYTTQVDKDLGSDFIRSGFSDSSGILQFDHLDIDSVLIALKAHNLDSCMIERLAPNAISHVQVILTE